MRLGSGRKAFPRAALCTTPPGVRMVGCWPPVARPGQVYTQLTGRMDHELGRAVDFSHDERWMVSVGRSVGGVWLWDLESEQIVSMQPTYDPHWVQFLPDGKAAITVGSAGVY